MIRAPIIVVSLFISFSAYSQTLPYPLAEFGQAPPGVPNLSEPREFMVLPRQNLSFESYCEDGSYQSVYRQCLASPSIPEQNKVDDFSWKYEGPLDYQKVEPMAKENLWDAFRDPGQCWLQCVDTCTTTCVNLGVDGVRCEQTCVPHCNYIC